MSTTHDRTRILVEIALAIALAAVLNVLRLFRMPQGGTISLVMLPIMVLALRRGLAVGVTAGALYGIVDFFVDPYPPVHWIQFALDYPLAYAAVGIAGFLAPRVRQATDKAGSWVAWTAVGVILGTLARYLVHVTSGVVFFAEYAQGSPVLLYSLGYNVYVLISGAAAFAATCAVLPALQRLPRS